MIFFVLTHVLFLLLVIVLHDEETEPHIEIGVGSGGVSRRRITRNWKCRRSK